MPLSVACKVKNMLDEIPIIMKSVMMPRIINGNSRLLFIVVVCFTN
jgi:hypothetical protein